MLKSGAAVLLSTFALAATAGATPCTSFPNPLSNGNVASATDVMNDLSYLPTCLAPLAYPSFTGRVGIGISSPSRTLDVFQSGSNDVMRIANTIGSARAYLDFLTYPSETSVSSRIGAIDVGNYNNALVFEVANSNAAGSTTAEAMRILNTGNVGIATVSPLQKLDVNGTAKSTNSELGGTAAYQSYNMYWDSGYKYRASGYGFMIRNAGSHLDFMTFPSGTAGSVGTASVPMTIIDNKVGFGTSPLQPLDVGGVAKATHLELAGSGGYQGFNVYSSGGWIYRGSDYGYIIRDAGSHLDFMTMPSGTAGTAGTTSTAMSISGTSVGINNVTAPAYTLQVNGSVAGTSAYNNLSDARLKKDVTPIADALATIEKLRGVHFRWRTPAERPVGKSFDLPVTEPQVGFIAQELKTALPEAVTTAKDKDAIMSVEESKVVPVLVEAVKQLKAENDKLQIASARDNTNVKALLQAVHQQQDEITKLKNEVAKLNRNRSVASNN